MMGALMRNRSCRPMDAPLKSSATLPVWIPFNSAMGLPGNTCLSSIPASLRSNAEVLSAERVGVSRPVGGGRVGHVRRSAAVAEFRDDGDGAGGGGVFPEDLDAADAHDAGEGRLIRGHEPRPEDEVGAGGVLGDEQDA